MAHITAPEPQITLYETGFEQDIDLLDRAATGKSLSDLVMRIDDPMVIALDGGWGSGKSFFLKCWVGEHLKKHGETSQTVYFDAFAHDFIDTPLVSLLTRMGERFPYLNTDGRTKFERVKDAAGKLVPAGIRTLAHLATLVASRHLGETQEAIAEIVGVEIANSAGDIWSQAKEQHDAMEEFRLALTNLTGDEGAARKLIIVIDELDRCRPDYALSLLEIIKHFFAVPNVHFVLGVNMVQLENSVKARYGAGIDAGLYLQKFVGLTMRLPIKRDDDGNSETISLYLKKTGEAMGLEPGLLEPFEKVLRCTRFPDEISLRSVERVLTLVALLPNAGRPFPKMFGCYQFAIATLLIAKVHRPPLYSAVRRGEATLHLLGTEFQFQSAEPEEGSRLPYTMHQAWAAFLAPDPSGSKDGWGNFFPALGIPNGHATIVSLIENDLETFTLPQTNP